MGCTNSPNCSRAFGRMIEHSVPRDVEQIGIGSMHTRTTSITCFGVLLIATIAPLCSASVTQYTNFSQWQSAGGPFTTITFAEFPPGPPLTTEYATLGLVFTDGHTGIAWGASEIFPADGAGVFGTGGPLGGESHLLFTQPMTSIGGSFPSGAIFDLYSQGSLIYSGTPGDSLFFGLVSTHPFDAAVIRQPR